MLNAKRTAILAALAATLVSPSLLAQLSGNVGVVSEYYYRGLLQTDSAGTPSVSGGLDYAHDSGFYVGTWAAAIESDSWAGGLEWDAYAGYAGEIGGFGYDVGVFFYGYPDAGTNDTTEFYISGSYGVASLTYNYSDDWFGSDLDASYLNLGLSFELSETLALDVGVGYTFGDAYKDAEYVDYSVTLTKAVTESLSASMSLIGTDLDKDKGEIDYSGPRFIIGATYSFDL